MQVSVPRQEWRAINLVSASKPETLFYIFLTALVLFYGVVPAYFALAGADPKYAQLTWLTVASVAGMLLGYRIDLFDSRISSETKIAVNSTAFHIIVWATFFLFLVLVLSSAPSIPIVSALSGADTNQLSIERGEFLKLRRGLEASYQYLDTIFISLLLPYSLALMILERRAVWPCALALFLIYSVVSLQKALFLRVFSPIAFLSAQKKVDRPILTLFAIGLASVGLILLNTTLERGFRTVIETPRTERPAASIGAPNQAKNLAGYFSAQYTTSGVIDQILWRSFAVPIFTAADALTVYEGKLGSHPVWGATSAPIAALTGRDRVPFESMVFAHQWGESDIGRSNSVFFIELLVNFGWFGVVVGSIVIGMTFRWFSISSDYAFKALVGIYIFTLFSSGIIGTFLSNGYLVLFGSALLFEIGSEQ